MKQEPEHNTSGNIPPLSAINFAGKGGLLPGIITPELLAERFAQLPPESQARLRAEFAERPPVHKTKIVIRKPRKK